MRASWRMARAVALAVGALVAVPAGAAASSPWIVVKQTGEAARASGAAVSARVGPGTYEVRFARDVRGCTPVAQVSSAASATMADAVYLSLTHDPSDRHAIHVQTFDRTARRLDLPFHLQLQCARGVPWVAATKAGTVDRGAHVRSLRRVDVGRYEVRFDRDVSFCTPIATVSGNGTRPVAPGFVSLAPLDLQPDGVFVATFDPAGRAGDRPFSLEAVCGDRALHINVTADGDTASSSHLGSRMITGTDAYEVFTVPVRSLAACSWVATAGTTDPVNPPPFSVVTALSATDPSRVEVTPRAPYDGTPDARGFYLAVAC